MIEFYTLGTSSAVPTTRRDLASNFLNFQGTKMLFDCGEGAQESLMSQKLGLMDIDMVFITHWHADHFSGLLGLVQTLGMEGRDRPLYIYGPPRSEEFTKRLLELGYFDRRYDIYVDDLEPGDTVEGDDYTVEAFETAHRIPSLGFVLQEDTKVKASRERMEELGLQPSPKIGRLKAGETVEIDGRTIEPEDVVSEVPGRRIVYTGDTEYSKKVVEAARDADLLVHEATFSQELVEDGRHGHTSARQAARVAKEAGVERLVLTHFSRRFDNSPERLEEEAKQVFEDTMAAEDGQKFEIEAHRPEG
jgi:ribonuclease Z